MKVCNVCEQEKPLTEFYKNKSVRSGLERKCKSCAHAYQRARRAAMWPKLFEYMGSKCAHCGLEDDCPAVYDMHHINPDEKEGHIASLIRGSWTNLN